MTASEEGHYKIFYHQNAKIGQHDSRADFDRAVLDSFGSSHAGMKAEELLYRRIEEVKRGQTSPQIVVARYCHRQVGLLDWILPLPRTPTVWQTVKEWQRMTNT